MALRNLVESRDTSVVEGPWVNPEMTEMPDLVPSQRRFPRVMQWFGISLVALVLSFLAGMLIHQRLVAAEVTAIEQQRDKAVSDANDLRGQLAVLGERFATLTTEKLSLENALVDTVHGADYDALKLDLDAVEVELAQVGDKLAEVQENLQLKIDEISNLQTRFDAQAETIQSQQAEIRSYEALVEANADLMVSRVSTALNRGDFDNDVYLHVAFMWSPGYTSYDFGLFTWEPGKEVYNFVGKGTSVYDIGSGSRNVFMTTRDSLLIEIPLPVVDRTFFEEDKFDQDSQVGAGAAFVQVFTGRDTDTKPLRVFARDQLTASACTQAQYLRNVVDSVQAVVAGVANGYDWEIQWVGSNGVRYKTSELSDQVLRDNAC